MKLGDRVTWTSQAGSYEATKTGTVIYLSDEKRSDFSCLNPRAFISEEKRQEFRHASMHQGGRMRADWCGFGVIVEVERSGKRGPLPSLFYCPRRSALMRGRKKTHW